jgi:hypothetical protein
MMRRTIVPVAVFGVALALAGCNRPSADRDNQPTAATTAPTTTAPAPSLSEPAPGVTPAADNCADPNATTAPANAAKVGAEATCGSLKIKVAGTCTSKHPVLNKPAMWLEGSGFDGSYRTRAWHPDGRPYMGLHSSGTTADGIKDWSWDCADTGTGVDDPAGIYTVMLVDVSTNKAVATQMKVSYDK